MPNIYAAARDIWPLPTSLEKKHYGSLGDLRATAVFIRETGLGHLNQDERRRRRRMPENWLNFFCATYCCAHQVMWLSLETARLDLLKVEVLEVLAINTQ